MTSSLVTSAADQRRAFRSVSFLMAALLAGGVVGLVNGVLHRSVADGLLAGVPLLAAAGMVWAARLIRRGEVERGVTGAAVLLLAITIPGTAAQYSGNIVMSGPIVVVCLALPYLSAQRLRTLCLVAAVVAIIDVVLAEFSPRVEDGPVPAWVRYVAFGVISTVITFYLLHQFAARMVALRVEEQQGRREVEQLSAMVQAVVHAAPVTIVVFDAAGVVKLWNPAAERMFGLTVAQALGSPLSALLDWGPEAGPLFAQLGQGVPVSAVEVQAGRRGGPLLQLEAAASPLRDGGGITGFVVVGSDVTARKQLEAELMQAQKMESVGLLAGGVAHDFNNLLTVITAEASLLTGTADPKLALESVEAITDASQRATALCKQLLSFSRRQLVQPRAQDLGAVLTGLVPLLRRMVGNDLHLHYVPPPEPLVVTIDGSQFEQVVMNLVVNARDAMPHGGEVFLSLESSGARVHLSVRDAGPGIADDVRARIFEPFFTTKGPGRGTGLGLATVAEVVKRAGGRVDVQSRLGEGTRFLVDLPAAEAPVAPLVVPPPRTRQRTLRVLLVDDEPQVRSVVERVLTADGFDVVALADPLAALSALEGPGAFDLLVTDVMMPGLNGRPLAERAWAVSPRLPVLFMSGYSSDTTLAAMVEEGRAHFLPKPFDAERLLVAVARALAAPPGQSVPTTR